MSTLSFSKTYLARMSQRAIHQPIPLPVEQQLGPQWWAQQDQDKAWIKAQGEKS